MSVRRIDYDGVHLRLVQRGHTLHRVVGNPDAGGYAQTPFIVLGRIRVGLHLRNILVGQQPDQAVVVVHDRQFLDFVLQQDVRSGL